MVFALASSCGLLNLFLGDPPPDTVKLPMDKVPAGIGEWNSAAFMYRALTVEERSGATKAFREAYARAVLEGFQPGTVDGPLGEKADNFILSFQGPEAIMQTLDGVNSAIAWGLLAPRAYWVPPEIMMRYMEMDKDAELVPRGVPVSDAVRTKDGVVIQRFSFGEFRSSGGQVLWVPDVGYSISPRTKYARGVFGPDASQTFVLKDWDVVRYTLDRREPDASSPIVPPEGVPLVQGMNLVRARMWPAGSTTPSPVLTLPVWFEKLEGGELVPDGDFSEGRLFYNQVKNVAGLPFELSFPEGALRLDPGASSLDQYAISIGTPDLKFLAEVSYVLRFRAKADGPRRITAELFERGNNGDSDGDGVPWELWCRHYLDLTTAYQAFSLVFQVPRDSDKSPAELVGALKFLVGGYPEAVFLDDLSILPYGTASVTGTITYNTFPRLLARGDARYSNYLRMDGTSNYLEAVLDVPAGGVSSLNWGYYADSYPEILVSVYAATDRSTPVIEPTDVRPVDLSGLSPESRYYFRVERKDGQAAPGDIELWVYEGSAQ
jgi:hypothetical protein